MMMMTMTMILMIITIITIMIINDEKPMAVSDMAHIMACCDTLQLQLYSCLVLLFKTKGVEEKKAHTDMVGAYFFVVLI